MSFVRRRIDITFELGTGTFENTTSNAVKLTGLRSSASITTGDSAATAELNLRVYGLNQSIAKSITLLNQDWGRRMNKGVNYVTVEAGNEGGPMTTVFAGGINEAWCDFAAMPDTSFIVQATTALVDRYKPGTPTSFPVPIDAALAMQTIAAKMDPPRRLENNGVQVMMPTSYYHGSMLEQMNDLARDGDFSAIIDEKNGNLVMWPHDGTRQGQIPLVSKDTGMVGYPAFTQYGVQVTCLFNPNIASGGKVQVESGIASASGSWYVYVVGHDLEAEVPGGRWFTHFEGSVAPEQRPYG